MCYTVKFVFHLKSGKLFECLEELSIKQFKQMVNVCKTAMRDGVEGVLSFSDCAVRLSEVAVAEWEVLNEPKAKKS